MKYKREKQHNHDRVYLGKCLQADCTRKYIGEKTIQEETLSPFLQKTETERVSQQLKLLILLFSTKIIIVKIQKRNIRSIVVFA